LVNENSLRLCRLERETKKKNLLKYRIKIEVGRATAANGKSERKKGGGGQQNRPAEWEIYLQAIGPRKT